MDVDVNLDVEVDVKVGYNIIPLVPVPLLVRNKLHIQCPHF